MGAAAPNNPPRLRPRRFKSLKQRPLAAIHPCDFCAFDLIPFCFQTLPLYVNDKNLLVPIQTAAQQSLASSTATTTSTVAATAVSSKCQAKHNPRDRHHQHHGCSCSCQEPYLHDLELCLMTLLDALPSLPSLVVASLYTCRGLIFLKLNDPDRAYECFLHCLWIQSSVYCHKNLDHSHQCCEDSSNDDKVPHHHNYYYWRLSPSHDDHHLELASTAHRLGVALGRAGNHVQAMDQLKWALASYEKAQVRFQDGRHVHAQHDLGHFQEERQLCRLHQQASARHHHATVATSSSSSI